MKILKHPLFDTLVNLRGNARGVVYTEPLWAIPFNLYAPYVSIYMLALGLDDKQIGLVVSIGLGSQILFAMLSGALTDKMGRKRATFVFDILSWGIPTLIWAVSQNFWYFAIAAIFNAAWRVPMTSWTCLLVEDTDPKLIVDVYSWIYISNLVVGFAAPLTGFLIAVYSLVPTMRVLYVFAFFMMMTKFIVTNRMVKETQHGLVRMEETRHQGLFSMLGEYRGIFRQILATPQTLFTFGIMLSLSAAVTVYGTFWAILVTQKMGIPEQNLAFFTFSRSIVMLFFFFLAMPRIKEMRFRNPMVTGFLGMAVSQLILISIPGQNYVILLISVIIEACSYAMVSTLTDRMVAVVIDPKERARIMSIIYFVIIIFVTPFGWIAGSLSTINRLLPFMMNIILLCVGAILTYLAARIQSHPLNHSEEALKPSESETSIDPA